MSKLSVVILSKNEEEMIADCIDSVSFADEIILIDSGSTDRTRDIAKHMGAKVYEDTTISFAERRNLGAKKARYEWLLYIDADERLEEDLVASIKYSLGRVPLGSPSVSSGRIAKDRQVLRIKRKEYVAYKLKRKNYYLGKHEWPTIERLERVFKKKALKGWKGDLHETAVVDGTVGELDGYLSHFTHRDLSSMLNKTIRWSYIEANLRYEANHPPMTWWRFLRVMSTAFYDSYIRQKGYKLGVIGLIESIFQAFSMFITYARLWEMQEQARK